MICPICSSDKIFSESKFRNKDKCFSNFERVSCENCKLHFANLTSPKEFLNSYLKYLKIGVHIFIEVPCMDWKHKKLDEPHLLFFDKPSITCLMGKLNLTKISIGYFGITIKSLLNPMKNFIKRLRNFLWRKGISFYHPEKKNLLRLGLNNLEAGAVINFEPHIEKSKPSWWLRVLFKK